ncbi:MAG TPA: LrgB family protein [Acidimicrobiales bacterium]|jgi:putative effector of murein hydrolase
MSIDLVTLHDGVLATVWTLFTLVVFGFFRFLERRRPSNLSRQAILATALVVAAVLWVLDTDSAGYDRHTSSLTWMLGPATVALGVPLARRLVATRQRLVPLLVAIVAGGAAAGGTAVGVAWLTNGPDALRIPLSAKSITTPIALAVTEPEGAAAGLVAGLVIVTGVLGAVLVPAVLRRLGATDPTEIGIAMGTTSHAIGTASLARHAPLAVGMSGLALAVNGAATSIWLPVVYTLASN